MSENSNMLKNNSPNIDCSNPIIFAITFVEQMRRLETVNTISTRQAIAIPKMIFATLMRAKKITPSDFIRAAVLTTPPEDQEFAYRVAQEILFPKVFLTSHFPTSDRSSSSSKLDKITGKDLSEGVPYSPALTQAMLDELEDLQEEFSEEMKSFNENGSSFALFGEYEEEGQEVIDFYFEAISNWRKELEPFKSLLDSLDDPTAILNLKIKSLEKLKATLEELLKSQIGSLSDKALRATVFLPNLQQEILKNSSNDVERMVSAHAEKRADEFRKYLDHLVRTDPCGATRAAKALRDSKQLSQAEFLEILDEIADRISTISNLFNVIIQANKMSPKMKEKAMEILLAEESLRKALDVASSIDEKIDSSLTIDVFKERITPERAFKEKELNFHTFTYAPIYSKALEGLIKKRTREEIQKLIEERDLSQFRISLEKMLQALSNLRVPYYYAAAKSLIDQTASDYLCQLSDIESFMQEGREFVSKGVKLTPTQIRAHGENIGCNPLQLAEILQSDFEVLMARIEEEGTDVKVYKYIIDRIGLTKREFREATEKAIIAKNRSAVAALASSNLELTSTIMQGDESREKLLPSSLIVSPTEDLILQWYVHREKLPTSLRKRIKTTISKKVIEFALEISSKKIGSADSGLLPSRELRPFFPGDDFALVDIESTLDNLINLGKSPKEMTFENIAVHETKKGRIQMLFLLDISGSMAAQKLTAVTLLATLLIAHLRREEVAIALFESDTYAMKRFNDLVDIDQVIAEILELKAKGGTRILSAFDWAKQELIQNAEKDSYFILMSDFEFYDDPKTSQSLKDIAKLRPISYLITPTQKYNIKMLESVNKLLRGHILNLGQPKEIIETAIEILTRKV